jgi:hypothetical protein
MSNREMSIADFQLPIENNPLRLSLLNWQSAIEN